MGAPKDYASDVRGHYEELPYPHRDPEIEGTNIYAIDGMSLDAYNHFGWAGKRDLRKDMRLLIAGCGTGDGAVFYAEQLVGSDSEIVAIDLSQTSIAIAKARLAKRGLSDRVTFHHLSILDVPAAGLGEFDIIESGGVLHHLPDPNAGLAALAKVLKDDGLMAIMVYGLHGRLSIYLVQELMRHLMDETTPRARKIEIAREFLNNVPNHHWITMNNERFMADMTWPDGSGIYDLFLHAIDKGYTVPELYDWLESAGLQLTEFFSEFTDDCLYLPEAYATSPLLRSITSAKTPRERHTIAELMNGAMYKHYFYAGKQAKTPAQLADDMVITYGPLQWLFSHALPQLIELLEKTPLGHSVEVMLRPFAHSPKATFTRHPHTISLIQLIDGVRTVGEMVQAVMHHTGAAMESVVKELEVLYREMRARQFVFLRHASIPPYTTVPDMIARLERYQGKRA